MTNSKATLIAFEGPDGVGKTSQLKLFADYLRSQNKSVYETRNLGGTPIGEELRKVSFMDLKRPPETDLHISLAVGFALAEDLALKKKQNQIILIDRSPLAIIPYQIFGSGLMDKDEGLNACQKLLSAFQIDVILYLNASQSTVEDRRVLRNDRNKSNNYYEDQGAEFHKRTRDGYEFGLKFITENLPDIKIINIDASPPIDQVQKQIQESLDTYIN